MLVPQAALDEVEQGTFMATNTRIPGSFRLEKPFKIESKHYPNATALSLWRFPQTLKKPLLFPNSDFCISNSTSYLPLFRLLEEFAGNPDQHAVGKLGFQPRFGEFIQHLGHSQAVVFPKVIEQPQSMILWNGKQRGRH